MADSTIDEDSPTTSDKVTLKNYPWEFLFSYSYSYYYMQSNNRVALCVYTDTTLAAMEI